LNPEILVQTSDLQPVFWTNQLLKPVPLNRARSVCVSVIAVVISGRGPI